MKLSLLALTLGLVSGGCSGPVLPSLPPLPSPGVPFVHKIDVQQGNVVTQEMVAQLRLGMNKKKVRFVMGSPIIQDTFHSERWDYVYTFHEGGGSTDRRLVTVIFNADDQLINVEGDIKPALGRLEVDKHQDTSVQVPGEYEKGLLGKLKDSIPFTGKDEPEPDADDEAKDPDKQADNESERIAEAEKNAVTVPEGAPPKKKKGFFKRLVDAVGLGAEEEEDEDDEEREFDPGDPKYRDPTDPEFRP